jgi:hypothetical protein
MSPSSQPSGASTAPYLGVSTTTLVAFVHAGELYLERMCILAEDGAGIVCATLPPVGAELPLCFRLSTARTAVRCRGKVLAPVATTPAGVALREREGDRAFRAAVGAAIGDSATAVFRMADLEGKRAKRRPRGAAGATAVVGFSVRFVTWQEGGQEAVRRHIAFSQRLREQLAARGEGLVSTSEDERPTLASYFDEGDLSGRAKDW